MMRGGRFTKLAVQAVLVLAGLLLGPAAIAGTPSLTFTEGWVGEYASNANQPDRMYAFDGGTIDLNIKSVTISQNSSTEKFEIPGSQGNDVPVIITINFVNGTQQTVQGKVNWEKSTSGSPAGVGLIFDQIPSDGYSLSANLYKTYLLKVKGSALTVSDGGRTSGNASGALAFLNSVLQVLPSFSVSKSAPASVVEGGALAYTIGIGNAGGAVSGTSVTIQDALPAGVSYVSATVGTRVSSVSCSQSGQNVNCTATLSSALPAYSAKGTAAFTINTTAPTAGTSITNYVSIDPNGTASPAVAAGCTSATCANVSTTLTGSGVISGTFNQNNGNAVSGATVNLLNSSDGVVTSTTTNASGVFQFTGLRAGTYGVRFVSNGAQKFKAKSNTGRSSGEYIRDLTVATGATISDADAIVIDPAGVIYDSKTRLPVTGAVVRFLYNGTLVNNAWLDQTLGGPNTQTTAADGKYSFVLNGTASDGTYTLDVTAPGGYTFQSTVIAPTAGPYNPGLGGGIVAVQPQSAAPTGSESTTYYLDFAFAIGAKAAQTSNGVINNHIPIDPVRTVTIANTTNAGEPSTNGTMTVSMSEISGTDTKISYSVEGTASAGTDYAALTRTVTILARQTSATIPVSVIDDGSVEGEETVIVKLTGVTEGVASLSATAADLTATNRISDNDAPIVSIAKTADAAELGTDGAVTVTLSAASGTATVVTYSMAGTATSGADYTARTGSVTIEAGQTSATISVPVADDNLVEGDETVIVALTGVTSGLASLSTTPANLTATVTIADNDTTVASIANTTDASEPTTAGSFTVSLTNAVTTDTDLAYTVSGTALAGTDYTTLAGTVTVTKGNTTATISVAALDDDLVEGGETVIVTLTSVTGARASLSATPTATNTIADDDATTVSIANTTNAGEPTIAGSMTVSLTKAATTDIVVEYEVSGTALPDTAGPNADYTALGGTVSIAKGTTSATISVAALDDGVAEGEETVIVTLKVVKSGTATLNADSSKVTATNRISDNDAAIVSIAKTADGAESGTDGTVTVTLSAASDTPTEVTYLLSGTATSVADYAARTGSVTIAAEQTSATISVPVVNDSLVEGDETVIVTLTGVTSGLASLSTTPANLTATVTIADNDTTVVRIVNTTNAGEGLAVAGSFTVSLTNKSASSTVVAYTITGTATPDTDYTALSGSVTIAAGQDSATISVAALEDNLVEGDETIILRLTGVTGVGASLSTTDTELTATNTIADNDTTVVRIANTRNAGEGLADGWFTVTLTKASATPTEISYRVSGTAGSGTDYTAIGDKVTIAAGATSETIIVAALEDVLVEGNETVIVTLTAVTSGSASLSTTDTELTATNTIADNDTATVRITNTTNGGEGSAAGALTVTLAKASTTDTVVSYLVTGTATTVTDYAALTGSVTIAAGQTTATISVAAVDDNLVEGNETVIVTLTAVTSGSASLSTTDTELTATNTIADNDTNSNTAPTFTGTNATDASSAASYAFSYAENSAAGAVLGRATATDPDGDTVTFSITGNIDGWYAINSRTGEITLTAGGATSLANDFERQPNSRNLTVAAFDGTNTSTIEVRLSETDLRDDPPIITGPSNKPGAATDAVSVNENQTAVARVTADKPVSWSISGGSEAGRFAIGPDGTIIFVPAPDYERPADADANNTYILIVTATDAANRTSAAQTITVTVLNVDDTAPLITGPSGGPGAEASALTIDEGLKALTTFTADEKVTWSLDGGSDAASFRIDPVTGALVFVATPDFELPTDSDRNNTYVVRIKAVDVAGNFSYQTLTVTVANVDEIGRKLAEINDKLRTSLRSYAAHGLSDMLSFNETLMRSVNDNSCDGPIAQKGLSGSANANQGGGRVQLDYSKRLTDCGGRHQVSADFGLTYSKLAGNWTSRMFASLRYEAQLQRDLTVGAVVLASQASDTLTGFANSAISDESLQLNLYGRYDISPTLRTGAFAGLGRGKYDFGLAEDDGFIMSGTMSGRRIVYGWMLSGEFNLGETVITSDAIVSYARENLGSAKLAARYLSENRSGIAFTVGSVETTRISVPLTAPIKLMGNDQLGKSARLLLSPGLLCEDNDVQLSVLRCGYQVGAKLVANDGGRNRFYADYHWESVAGMRRSLIGLGYALRFGGDSGLEVALEANRGVSGMAGQDNRAMIAVRLAQ